MRHCVLPVVLLVALTSWAGSSPAEAEGSEEMAGWLPDEGGFVLRSDDDSYRLHLGLESAFRYEPTWHDGDAQSQAEFFVVRPYVDGTVYRSWIRYFLSLQVNDNPPFLLDFFIGVRPWSAFGLAVGQQLTPFSRHEWRMPHELLFPDWDVVADIFSPGRDKGAMASGSLGEGKLEYWVGAYEGSPPRQFRSFPGSYRYLFRLTASPMGTVGPTEMPYALGGEVPFRYSFSLQGNVSNTELVSSQLDPASGAIISIPTGMRRKDLTGGIDFALQDGRLSFFSEAYIRRTEPDDEGEGDRFVSVGFWAQAGYVIYGRTVALGARWSWLEPDTDVGHDRFNRLEGLVAWFVDPTHFHLQLRYGIAHQEEPSGGPGVVPLIAPIGTTQSLTLQAGVFF